MTKATTTNARTANKPAAPAPAPTADQAQQEAATTGSATQEPNDEAAADGKQDQAETVGDTAASAGAAQPVAELQPEDAAGKPQDSVRDYEVTSVPIRHDGKFYDVGDLVKLTDKQADRLGGLVFPLYLDKE